MNKLYKASTQTVGSMLKNDIQKVQ